MQISNVMPEVVRNLELVVRHELREGGIARRPQGNSKEVAYAVATADLDKCGGVRVFAASVKVGYGLGVPVQLVASTQITAGAVALLRGDDEFDFARENEALLASAQPEVGAKPRPVPVRVVENGIVRLGVPMPVRSFSEVGEHSHGGRVVVRRGLGENAPGHTAPFVHDL